MHEARTTKRNRKGSYMQQESVRNKKDIKITNNQEEKTFTSGDNHSITRRG